jgi:hypothetical protein
MLTKATTIRIFFFAAALCAGAVFMQHLGQTSMRIQKSVSDSTHPIITSKLFGPVASGTIYTTLINLNELEKSLPITTPYIIELSASGTIVHAKQVSDIAIDYVPGKDGGSTLGRFVGPGAIKSGWYQVRNDQREVQSRLTIQDNSNTDVHGITHLENGNYIVPSYKMHIDEGGSVLQSFLIEEQTPQGEVVFVWDSINHVSLTEASYTEVREYWIENDINNYFHGNSVAEAQDGNLLISGRHVNMVIKIDRYSGEVLWRLGGKLSDFVFVDDPRGGFSHQHSVSQLSNGNILLYDNGNLNETQISRVVEYKIDETTKTATLVWSYTDGRFTYATGSVQRLSNGNTFIGWGLERTGMSSTSPRMTEVNPEGKVVMHIYTPDDSGFYNAFKY